MIEIDDPMNSTENEHDDRPAKGMVRREFLHRATGAAAGLAWRAGPSPGAAMKTNRSLTDIRNDRLSVTVAPDEGASLISFKALRAGTWVDIYPDARDASVGLRHASWMMIPYANRIENGKFMFEGKAHQLRHGERHAIHGDARTRPWTVAGQSEDRIRLTLRSMDFPNFNWPWPIEIEATLGLDGLTFLQTLRIRNLGDTAMPAGFGWHPYYPRALTRAGEPVRMRMQWGGVYPDPNGDCIPDGPMEPLPADLDYSSVRAIPTDRRYDTCLGGYDGNGSIEWPDSGVRLEYACSPNVTHFVYFNPIERPYFAAEPTANANNGVNHIARGWPDHGVIVLGPGEAADASFASTLTLEG